MDRRSMTGLSRVLSFRFAAPDVVRQPADRGIQPAEPVDPLEEGDIPFGRPEMSQGEIDGCEIDAVLRGFRIEPGGLRIERSDLGKRFSVGHEPVAFEDEKVPLREVELGEMRRPESSCKKRMHPRRRRKAALGDRAVHEGLKPLKVACGNGPRVELGFHDGEPLGRSRVMGLLGEDHAGDLRKDIRSGHPAGRPESPHCGGIKRRMPREREIAQNLT